jgi:hypothetical protein
MSPSSSMSLARRLAASMSLAGVACGLGWFAFGDLFRSYLMMGLAGLAGVASL